MLNQCGHVHRDAAEVESRWWLRRRGRLWKAAASIIVDFLTDIWEIRLGPLRILGNLASAEACEKPFFAVTRDHDRTRRVSEDPATAQGFTSAKKGRAATTLRPLTAFIRAGVFARLPYVHTPPRLAARPLPDEETHAPPLDRSLPAEGA